MQFLGLMAGLFGLDILLKGKIEAGDKEDFPRDMEGTSGKIRLYRNHNDGFCFGLLKNNQELVKTVLVFTSAVTGVFFWLLTRKSRLIDKLGFSLVTAGALSNLFDRVKRGYVVDYFFSFQFGWLKKVVFNIGDICIFLGTFLLAVSRGLSPARRADPEESRNTGQIKRMELWSSNT